jgi:hypothetical protein
MKSISNPPTVQQLLDIIQGYENLVMGIQAALDTEETGSNLIEVARDACEAERTLAALQHKIAADVVGSMQDDE